MATLKEYDELHFPIETPVSLMCPRCGCEYVHHHGVIVYDRREDAELTTESHVVAGKVSQKSVASDRSRNPSMRRDGVAIGFWCECCGDGLDNEGTHDLATLELVIEQHKGVTYLRWRRATATERKIQPIIADNDDVLDHGDAGV